MTASLARRFEIVHVRIVGWIGLAAATFVGATLLWWAAPLVVCGPFAAAVATGAKFPGRQGSVASMALALAPWGFAALALALLSQWLVPLGGSRGRSFRLLGWAVGWAGWFGCAVVSCLHAFGE